ASSIVRRLNYHRDNNALEEACALRYKEQELVLCGTLVGSNSVPRHRSSPMSKTAITSPELAPPVGPFSQAVNVGGVIYFSGQVGLDPTTGKLVAGGIVAEAERVFQNLAAVLKAAGKRFDDVARVGVYLTNMSDYAALNGVYAKHFSQPFPAR